MTKDLPLVSIIMPVRNGERYLRDALRSLAQQQYPHLELIVADGGSTDDTLNILAEAAREMPWIKIVSEPDRGQSDAMNKGLARARGSIVSFLNADDFYCPGAIQAGVRYLSSMRSPAIVVGDCLVHNLERGTVRTASPKGLGLEDLIHGGARHPTNPTQYFYHRVIHDLIGPFPVDDHFAMDLWFFLEVFSRRQIKTKHVAETWGNFRLYAGTKSFDNKANSPQIRSEYYARYAHRCRGWRSWYVRLRRKLRRLTADRK